MSRAATDLRAELAAKIATRTDMQLIDTLVVADAIGLEDTRAGRMTVAYMVDELSRRFAAVDDAIAAWELDLDNADSSAIVAAEAARAVLAARRSGNPR